MRKPKNHLVIGGVDIFDVYGAVMTDDYDLGVPEVKTTTVDVPGGNGFIDLTDALTGDAVYGQRAMSFTLLFPGDGFWDKYRAFKRKFHGRAFDFNVKGIDEVGTYHGRFSVDGKSGNRMYGTVDLSVVADPYRFIRSSVVYAECGGGMFVTMNAGRCPVCPKLTVARKSEIVVDGAGVTVEAGTWKVDTLWLDDVPTTFFVNTCPDLYGDVAIKSLGTVASLASTAICDASWTSKPSGTAYQAKVSFDIKEL